MKRKINLIILNAQSGAGKDYVVSLYSRVKKALMFMSYDEELFDEWIDRISEATQQRIHEVSSSDIPTVTPINWDCPNIDIFRFSTPLRNIVQSVAGTDFSMDEMDMQSTKKHVPEVLKNGQSIRDLHLVLSDAVKQALDQETIFSDLLVQKVRNRVAEIKESDYEDGSHDIIIQDARYLFEVETMLALGKELGINTVCINIHSNTKNVINHSSEVDLYKSHPHLFTGRYYNDKTLNVKIALGKIYDNFLPLI